MSNALDVQTCEWAAKRLRLYADAWNTSPGCSCDNCDLCAARYMTPAEAEGIADVIQALGRSAAHAARYAWLRENSATDSESGIHVAEPEQDFCERTLSGEKLDWAIDYELNRKSKSDAG